MNNIISLPFFEFILQNTDWEAKNRSVDPAARINGLTSIAHAADLYLSLTPMEQIIAKELIKKYAPYRWAGWRIVLKAAETRRKAFLMSIKVGVLSDNRQADNYFGHYFYTHTEGGRDYFRDRRTFIYVSSPFTKEEISKYAAGIIARYVSKE